MSYTKRLGSSNYSRSKIIKIYKGNNCDNCECNDETRILAFDSSNGEYGSINLCKNCIKKFIEIEIKHNKRCDICEDYFEELYDTVVGGYPTKMCKECCESD